MNIPAHRCSLSTSVPAMEPVCRLERGSWLPMVTHEPNTSLCLNKLRYPIVTTSAELIGTPYGFDIRAGEATRALISHSVPTPRLAPIAPQTEGSTVWPGTPSRAGGYQTRMRLFGDRDPTHLSNRALQRMHRYERSTFVALARLLSQHDPPDDETAPTAARPLSCNVHCWQRAPLKQVAVLNRH